MSLDADTMVNRLLPLIGQQFVYSRLLQIISMALGDDLTSQERDAIIARLKMMDENGVIVNVNDTAKILIKIDIVDMNDRTVSLKEVRAVQ